LTKWSNAMGHVRSVLLIWALLPPLAVAKDRVRDTTICEINSHPGDYAGKMVRVRGRVDHGIEWFGIAVEKCFLNVEYPIEPTELADMAARHVYSGPKMPANFKLLRDESFARFDRLTSEELPEKPGCSVCLGCYRYEVTVTLTGLFQVARQGMPGFGHMNAARSRLVIHSVSQVETVDLWRKYEDGNCGMQANPYPGWNRPMSVPPFPNARPNPK